LRKTTDAYEAYQLCLQKGVAVSKPTVTKLMEMLCAFNSEDPSESLQDNEQFFFDDPKRALHSKFTNSWKSDGLAENMFDALPEKYAECYNAMIRGRAKFHDVSKAVELYHEAIENKIPLDAASYNCVIGLSGFIHEGDGIWNHILETMGAMHNAGYKPCLETFQNALSSLNRSQRNKISKQRAMMVLNEMKACGVEPCLGTYSYILTICYQPLATSDQSSDLLNNIIDEIQGKHFSYKHPSDLEFFSLAMSRCWNLFKDIDLAYKINKVLECGKNMQLLGNSFKQNSYYTNFMRLLCLFEQIDVVMENYRKITPHVYTPSMGALTELFSALELNEGFEYLPELWTDLVFLDQTRNDDMVKRLVGLMAKKKQDLKLQELFMVAIKDILARIDADSKRRGQMKQLNLDTSLTSDIITVALHSQDMECAWSTFEYYYSKRHNHQDDLSENCLLKLSEGLIQEHKVGPLLKVLEILSEADTKKVSEIVSKAKASLELDEVQLNTLSNYE